MYPADSDSNQSQFPLRSTPLVDSHGTTGTQTMVFPISANALGLQELMRDEHGRVWIYKGVLYSLQSQPDFPVSLPIPPILPPSTLHGTDGVQRFPWIASSQGLPTAPTLGSTPRKEPPEYRLQVETGPENYVYDDAMIPIRLCIQRITPGPIELRRQGEMSVQVLDDRGNPVHFIQRGQRRGRPLLSQQTYTVTWSPQWSCELPNLRIREVTANHGGTQFTLEFTLNDSSVERVKSSPFHVRSKRTRSNSYKMRDRKRRIGDMMPGSQEDSFNSVDSKDEKESTQESTTVKSATVKLDGVTSAWSDPIDSQDGNHSKKPHVDEELEVEQ